LTIIGELVSIVPYFISYFLELYRTGHLLKKVLVDLYFIGPFFICYIIAVVISIIVIIV